MFFLQIYLMRELFIISQPPKWYSCLEIQYSINFYINVTLKLIAKYILISQFSFSYLLLVLEYVTASTEYVLKYVYCGL